jgi:ASC-1-like (ASCH) protein
LEIKVLELLDPKYDSSKGLCTELLQRVTEIAVSAKALAIHVKLLSTETGLFQFYARHGFTVIKEFPKSDSREVLQCVLQKSLSQPLPLAAVKEPVRLLVSLRENQPLTVGNYKPATLKNPYLPWIQQGKKTIEGRINAGMFSGVKAGDRFRFFNQSSEVFCRITSVKHYSSFEEMLAAENYKECIPQASSFEEAAGVYRQIPGYIERAKQSGVLALHLAVEPKPLLPTSSDQRRGIKRDRNGN